MKRTITTVIIIMISLLFVTGCDTSFTAPVQSQAATRASITTNQTGYDSIDNWYYSFWTDTQGSVTMTINGNRNYSTTWSNTGNFVCGKGKATGRSGVRIDYNATFNLTSGNVGYLTLYGWMDNPAEPNHKVVEYYIVENNGSYNPPGVSSMGTINVDGSTYDLYRTERVNQPWIVDEDKGTFWQYWSVRRNKRSSGSIDFKKHVNAWKDRGWSIGDFGKYYQIMATEGFGGCSGNSNVTITRWAKTGRAATRRYY